MTEVPGGTDGVQWVNTVAKPTASHRSFNGPFGFVVAVVSAGWLAACGTLPSETAVVPEVSNPATAAVASPRSPSASSAASRDVAADVAALVNMSPVDVIAAFGSPDFTRRDAPAEVWQYRSAACVLDVFFYPEGRNLRVAYATTRRREYLLPRPPGAAAIPHCRRPDELISLRF
jgi:hypothetical protein